MFTKCKISWGISKTRGVTHRGVAIYIEKYLKAKDESWETQIFRHEKNTILKKSCKRNQNPSRYYN